jgi:DNA-binding CsgD family transcriptional regulator
VPVPDAIVVAADVLRSVTTRRPRVVAPPGTRRAGSRIADLRDEVGGTAGLVLSVDLTSGDLWVTGPDADPTTAARVRHHVHRSIQPDPFLGGFLIGRQAATTAERAFGRAAWSGSPLRALCLDTLGVDQLLGAPMGRTQATVHLLLLGRLGTDFDAVAVARVSRLLPSPSGPTATAEPRAPVRDRDRVGLTPREHQVLAALGTGRTAYAISVLLGCSERTVHRHLQSIYRKLGTHDRRVTVARARELQLI